MLLNILLLIFLILFSIGIIFCVVDSDTRKNEKKIIRIVIIFICFFALYCLILSQNRIKNLLPTTYKVDESVVLEQFEKKKGCEFDNYAMKMEDSKENKLIYQKTINGRKVLKTIEISKNSHIDYKKSKQNTAELLIMKKVYTNNNIEKYLPYGDYGESETKEYQLIIPKKCKKTG